MMLRKLEVDLYIHFLFTKVAFKLIFITLIINFLLFETIQDKKTNVCK